MLSEKLRCSKSGATSYRPIEVLYLVVALGRAAVEKQRDGVHDIRNVSRHPCD